MNKRFLNVLFALVLIVCVLPLATFAACDECEYTKLIKINTAPTCTKEGTGVYACNICGRQTTKKPVPVTEHTYVEEILPAKAATCSATGLTQGAKCADCGEIKVEQKVVDALGHDYTELLTTYVAPTCSKDGDGQYKCSRCKVQKRQAIPQSEHIYKAETIPAVPSTCKDTGLTEGTKCANCQEIKVEQKVVDALGHDYTELLTTYVAPTCSKDGDGQYKCSRCRMQKRQAIPQSEHIYKAETIPAVPSTCKDTGLTEGTKCANCQEIKVEQKVVDALGHDYTELLTTYVAPTCSKDGDGQYKCSRCRMQKRQAIPQSEHIYKAETIPAVPSTCKDTGLTEGTKCANCQEIKVEQKVVDALGHDYTELLTTYVAPTCSKDGDGQYKCSRCRMQKRQAIPQSEHTYEEEILPAEAATCASTGLTQGVKCADCGEIKVAQEVVDKLPCDYSVVLQVYREASCIVTGWTNFQCSGCKSTKTLELDMIDHVSEKLDPVTANCTETGLREGSICTVCDEILVKQEVIPAEGHQWLYFDGKAANCNEDGYTDYRQCDVCDLIENYQVIKAAHKFNGVKCETCGIGDPDCPHDDKVFKHTDSTCTDPGRDSFWCKDCNLEIMSDELPLAAHQIEVQTDAATCTAKGETREVCTVCQQVQKRIELPMADHSYEDGVCACGATDPDYVAPEAGNNSDNSNEDAADTTEPECTHTRTNTTIVPATCETDGYKLVACEDCDYVIERLTYIKTGHDYVETGRTPASCTVNGAVSEKCSICNSTKTTVLPARGSHQYDTNGVCSACGDADPNKLTKDFLPIYFVN